MFPWRARISSAKMLRTESGSVSTPLSSSGPSPDLTFTLDGLYSRFTTEDQQRRFGAFTNTSQVTSAVVNDAGVVTSFDQFGPNAQGVIQLERYFRLPETKAIGFNTAWDVASNLRLTYDVAYSRVDDNPGPNSYYYIEINNYQSALSFFPACRRISAVVRLRQPIGLRQHGLEPWNMYLQVAGSRKSRFLKPALKRNGNPMYPF